MQYRYADLGQVIGGQEVATRTKTLVITSLVLMEIFGGFFMDSRDLEAFVIAKLLFEAY